MYHPYFRGKQYELITIRENAEILKSAGFVPIIEPVKNPVRGLSKTLSAVVDAGGEVVVIVNPYHGDHAHQADSIRELLNEEFDEYDGVMPGILLTEDMSVDEVIELCDSSNGKEITLIHSGFTEAKALVQKLGNDGVSSMRNVFLAASCGRLYRRHFKSARRILLRDGFEKKANRDYPYVEFFSDLHATYEEEGMQGFGDFLMVGDDYSETGGPAYAVAIHITFIDPIKDDEMHIHHFKSIRQDDPKDPAGKFAEALGEMINELDRQNNQILETNAIIEFRDLHARKHYPGLGYVKKLSMQHHIETLANYFMN
jgi:hypothetical protein